ncbi:MAG: CpsD/CapB family tyrosine-protein kinase [Planctomycetota bacterium]
MAEAPDDKLNRIVGQILSGPLERAPREDLGELSPRRIPRFEFTPEAAVFRDRSMMAEEYRALRANLNVLQEQEGIKTFVITSCHHREGKTTNSLNLALMLARNPERRVILVDADIRRPKIKSLIRLGAFAGIDDYLEGRSTLNEVMFFSEAENLYVIPARSGRSNATDLLEQSRMGDLVRFLHRRFDCVIYDTAPLLATADPMTLGGLADGVIVVVEAETTQRESIEHAIGLLQQAKIRILGFILNRVHFYLPRYLYRYQYYHDYYYRYYQGVYSRDEEPGEK